MSRNTIPNTTFRTPLDLAVTPMRPRRALAIGTCLINQGILSVFPNLPTGCPIDHILFNNVSTLSDQTPRNIEEYDFQLIQIPLETILNNKKFINLNYENVREYEDFLEYSIGVLSLSLESALKYNKLYGITTFVWNFQEPQINPLGRLLPRYDIRNISYFVSRLNEALEREIRKYKNAYMIDFDQICATIGRRYFQDDSIYTATHLGAIGNGDYNNDTHRLKPPTSVEFLYEPRLYEYYIAVWGEVLSAWRLVKGTDSVKMVVFDLDDTLWRGVVAEDAQALETTTLGWPAGIAEAALYLKKRGIILAIVSKNDEARVEKMWPQIWRGFIGIDDFAIRRINWRPKSENIADVMKVTNLLPHNIVFVDDNPAEREAVKAAFPAIRTLGDEPYLMRRILLWSAETQVLHITDESGRRSEMMVAQEQREEVRARMTREEFLATLEVTIRTDVITSADGPHFLRAFELINKTNQFNTTGKRWSITELSALFDRYGELLIWEVSDRFTAYGIVGVAVLEGTRIAQMVMSCRVFGLGVEEQVMPVILARLRDRGVMFVDAPLVKNDINGPCHRLYADAGFSISVNGMWRRAT